MSNVKYNYIVANNEIDRYNILLTVFQKVNINKSLIYVNTDKMNLLYSKLYFNDFSVSIVNSKYFAKYTNVDLHRFIRGETRVLLTDKTLPNYIKIPYMSLAIFYNLQDYCKVENFIHDIGSVLVFVSASKLDDFLKRTVDLNFQEIKESDLTIKLSQ